MVNGYRHAAPLRAHGPRRRRVRRCGGRRRGMAFHAAQGRAFADEDRGARSWLRDARKAPSTTPTATCTRSKNRQELPEIETCSRSSPAWRRIRSNSVSRSRCSSRGTSEAQSAADHRGARAEAVRRHPRRVAFRQPALARPEPRSPSRSSTCSRPGRPTTSCRAGVDKLLAEARQYPACSQSRHRSQAQQAPAQRRDRPRKAADMGISMETVGHTLETMLGGLQVTRFKREGKQYDVDRADRGRQAAPAERHLGHLRARPRRRDDPALQPGQVQRDGGPEGAQPLQQAARGDDHRQLAPGYSLRRGARLHIDGRAQPSSPDDALPIYDNVARIPRVEQASCGSPSCWRWCSSTWCCRRSSRASSARS